jgi:hypothetical protein
VQRPCERLAYIGMVYFIVDCIILLSWRGKAKRFGENHFLTDLFIYRADGECIASFILIIIQRECCSFKNQINCRLMQTREKNWKKKSAKKNLPILQHRLYLLSRQFCFLVLLKHWCSLPIIKVCGMGGPVDAPIQLV